MFSGSVLSVHVLFLVPFMLHALLYITGCHVVLVRVVMRRDLMAPRVEEKNSDE